MAKPKSDDQVKAFRKAARELECDESAKQFDSTLGKIAKAKVPSDKELAKLSREIGQDDPNANFGKSTKKE